jgi:hypothetical protein
LATKPNSIVIEYTRCAMRGATPSALKAESM